MIPRTKFFLLEPGIKIDTEMERSSSSIKKRYKKETGYIKIASFETLAGTAFH